MTPEIEALKERLGTIRDVNNASSIAAAIAAMTSLAHGKLDQALKPATDVMEGIATSVNTAELARSTNLLNRVKKYPRALRSFDMLGKLSKPALAVLMPIILGSSFYRQNTMEDLVHKRLDNLEYDSQKTAELIVSPEIEALREKLRFARSADRIASMATGAAVGTTASLLGVGCFDNVIRDKVMQHPKLGKAIGALAMLSTLGTIVGVPTSMALGSYRQGVTEDLVEAKFDALGPRKTAAFRVGFMSKLANSYKDFSK